MFSMSGLRLRGPGTFAPLFKKRWWAHLDSNQGPTGYEPVALAN